MGRWVLICLVAGAAATTSHYQSAQRKFQQIEANKVAPQSTVTFTRQEINDYARIRVEEVVPGAVRNPEVELRDNGAVGTALIDFAKLRAANGNPPGMVMRWLLSGERPVRVAVKLQSQGGNCTVDVERVEVSGVGIEGRALDFLIDSFLVPLYPGVKIGKPFELNHRVERIDVRPANVLVRIGS